MLPVFAAFVLLGLWFFARDSQWRAAFWLPAFALGLLPLLDFIGFIPSHVGHDLSGTGKSGEFIGVFTLEWLKRLNYCATPPCTMLVAGWWIRRARRHRFCVASLAAGTALATGSVATWYFDSTERIAIRVINSAGLPEPSWEVQIRILESDKGFEPRGKVFTDANGVASLRMRRGIAVGAVTWSRTGVQCEIGLTQERESIVRGTWSHDAWLLSPQDFELPRPEPPPPIVLPLREIDEMLSPGGELPTLLQRLEKAVPTADSRTTAPYSTLELGRKAAHWASRAEQFLRYPPTSPDDAANAYAAIRDRADWLHLPKNFDPSQNAAQLRDALYAILAKVVLIWGFEADGSFLVTVQPPGEHVPLERIFPDREFMATYLEALLQQRLPDAHTVSVMHGLCLSVDEARPYFESEQPWLVVAGYQAVARKLPPEQMPTAIQRLKAISRNTQSPVLRTHADSAAAAIQKPAEGL